MDATLSGIPQGRIASPVLSNIYLHKLDVFVETVLIPEYTRGRTPGRNSAYCQVASALGRARRTRTAASAACGPALRCRPSGTLTIPATAGCATSRYADEHPARVRRAQGRS